VHDTVVARCLWSRVVHPYACPVNGHIHPSVCSGTMHYLH
jgi:hypothetical protein